MKSIVMLGTLHLLSQVPGNDRASGLEKCLDYLRAEFGPQIVMEEWFEGLGESVAKAFANKLDLPWANVGTPDEPEYRTHCCPINHPGYHGSVRQPVCNAPQMHEHGPFENQEAREKRMAKNVEAQMEKYETGLFILGTAHLHSVFAKLRSLGFKVVAFSWL